MANATVWLLSFVDISVITELNNIIAGVFNASSDAILAFREVRNTDYKLVDFKCIAYNKSALALINKPAEEMDKHPSIKTFAELAGSGSFDRYVKVVEDRKTAVYRVKDC